MPIKKAKKAQEPDWLFSFGQIGPRAFLAFCDEPKWRIGPFCLFQEAKLAPRE
jgi:hypothetical protein